MKKFMKKLAKKTEGFTLVELIVVIAILGILAAVAVPAYSGYLEKANDAAVVVELDAIKTAAMGANAAAGEIDSINITDATNLTITATPLADNFDDDFKMFYDSGATVTITEGASGAADTATIVLSGTGIDNWANSSYNGGVVWIDGAWS